MIKCKITKNGVSKQITIPKEELERLNASEDKFIIAEFYPFRPVFEQQLISACKNKQIVEITLRDREETKKRGVVDEAGQTHTIIFDKENDRSEQIPFSIIKSIEVLK